MSYYYRHDYIKPETSQSSLNFISKSPAHKTLEPQILDFRSVSKYQIYSYTKLVAQKSSSLISENKL